MKLEEIYTVLKNSTNLDFSVLSEKEDLKFVYLDNVQFIMDKLYIN